MPQTASAVPAAKPARWSPSYPWIAYVTIGGFVPSVLILLAGAIISDRGHDAPFAPYFTVSLPLVGFSLLAGLTGMIRQLAALKHRGWTIALTVVFVVVVLVVIGDHFHTFPYDNIINETMPFVAVACFVLAIAAFGLFGPRPRHP
jgi:hypothetical protein